VFVDEENGAANVSPEVKEVYQGSVNGLGKGKAPDGADADVDNQGFGDNDAENR